MGRTVLFFGSFNPIHLGHVAMARYLLDGGLADEAWLVISPQNPFKKSSELAPEERRLAMARLAAGEGTVVCDVEFSMPRPSYTIDTLRRLRAEHPDREFAILIGSDNLAQLGSWREGGKLLAECDFLLYPREGWPLPSVLPSPRMTALADAPLWPYSSTAVRQALREGGGEQMVTPEVMAYIKRYNLYGAASHEVAALLAEGRALYRAGELDGALNCFIRVRALDPDHREAGEFVEQISEIFEFRYKDIYNP
ncbi:MAG: nicotinate (nicotinamide) nucleotide adenylyltransferase [Rikenellaceae bacterium]|jgi:nicotinate-nucleotide adenylyltransferase|nr:nicotinate (nicotinamide) nucleotide adenylyltransferase [Rikenellaceae bacterium]